MFNRYGVWIILIVGLGLRLYGITNPLLDAHAWRQADTASMAANFLEHGFMPLIPQLNYDGPPPNYVELEFPLSSLLISLTWKIAGQLDWLARAVEVIFSGATMLIIYLLGEELYDRKSGLIAISFFALNPMAIYFGRTVMPESSMIFFMTATVLFIVKWRKQQKSVWLLASALMFALAVLSKLPALLIGVPLFVVLLDKYGWRILKSKPAWIFVFIGLLPPLIYYSAANYYATTKYVSGIIQGQSSLQPDYNYLFKSVTKMVTLALIIPGIFAPFIRKSSVGNTFLYCWAGTLLLYTLSIGARIQLEYYLFPLIPLACVMTGATLGKFWGEAPGVISTLLILGTMANFAYKELPVYYNVQYDFLNQATKIQQSTRNGDLLILDDGPPMTFYYSNRKGWRLLPEKQTPAELERLRSLGAVAFVVLPGSNPSEQILQYLNSHYPLVRDGNFYDLRKSINHNT
ncbi:MAG TPA: glycosyltransferase family 39 protein [Candidatus Deferrimicrobium sp.]|nr:glycosyltransferase family 39 protein [Candidatus Deferrimicrobium sp.]